MHMGLAVRVGTPIANVVVAQDGTGDYNGTTGDTIQAAIDSLEGDGGWVFVKPGIYDLSTPLLMNTDSISLSGVYAKSILQAATDMNLVNVTGDACSFREMTLYGPGGAWGLYSALLCSGDSFLIDDCIVDSMAGTGIRITGNYPVASIISVSNCGGPGITLVGSNGFYVRENIISVCSTAIALESCSISGINFNFMTDCVSTGIYLDTCDSVFAGNNLAKNCGANGIAIDDSTKISLTSNYCQRSDDGFQQYGIIELGTSDYNLIANNMCEHNSTANYVILGGNDVIGSNGDWA